MSDHLPADATAATEADALTGLEGATADASGQTGRRLRPTLSGLRIRMDWRVAAGQVLLTALGVALALAGSAWWGDRQERVRERSELRNLLAAARVSERRLRQALYEDSTSLAIATRLLDSLGSVPDDSLPMLVGNSIWWSDAQPIVIPFSSLIQNGGIHLVRDARLRALLPTYVDELVARTRSVDLVNQARVALTAATLPNYVPDRLAPARTGSHRLAPARTGSHRYACGPRRCARNPNCGARWTPPGSSTGTPSATTTSCSGRRRRSVRSSSACWVSARCHSPCPACVAIRSDPVFESGRRWREEEMGRHFGIAHPNGGRNVSTPRMRPSPPRRPAP